MSDSLLRRLHRAAAEGDEEARRRLDRELVRAGGQASITERDMRSAAWRFDTIECSSPRTEQARPRTEQAILTSILDCPRYPDELAAALWSDADQTTRTLDRMVEDGVLTTVRLDGDPRNAYTFADGPELILRPKNDGTLIGEQRELIEVNSMAKITSKHIRRNERAEYYRRWRVCRDAHPDQPASPRSTMSGVRIKTIARGHRDAMLVRDVRRGDEDLITQWANKEASNG